MILDFLPPELWEINFCCLWFTSHSVYGVLLWKHKRAKKITVWCSKYIKRKYKKQQSARSSRNAIRQENESHSNWKGRHKIVPFGDGMTIYKEKPNNLLKKKKKKEIWETTCEAIRVSRYKITIKKSIAFLYTSNKHVDTDIKIQYHVTQKKRKKEILECKSSIVSYDAQKILIFIKFNYYIFFPLSLVLLEWYLGKHCLIQDHRLQLNCKSKSMEEETIFVFVFF